MGYFHSSTAARSTRRFPWHVLSKQRSCAPFNGILINTDAGNPTAPFTTALERQASFMRQVGTHNDISLYKGIKDPPFSPTPSSSSAYPSLVHSSSNAQARPFILNLLQRCPEQGASGWLPPSRRGKSKSLGRPDTCPTTSRTGSLRRGNSFPPLGLRRGWFSSLISSADWAFRSILSSGGLCSTTA